MSVVKRQSLRDLLFLQDRMNRLFENSMRDMNTISEPGEWIPHVDIYEDDSAITLKVELPGMQREDIMLDAGQGTLTISGRKQVEHAEHIECYHIMERQYGSFKRSVTFSDNVKVEDIEARYENGVLEVVLPKISQDAVRQIPITSG